MTLITLCMIVKNEENELPLVLSSAKELADEMVIYDTGSSDNSIVIARQFGAKVIEGYWDEDFSRARNEALEDCHGDWILWLDADEAIHGNFELARKILADETKLDAFLVPIESVELHGIGTAAAFHATRVFRRSKCHWVGPLHEQVTLRSNGDFPAAVFMPHLRILHRGYTNLKWKSKDLTNRNLTIAKKALDDPTVPHARALFDYGRTMTQGEDPLSAVPILEEAAETTDSPTIKRASFRIIFEVYLSLAMLDKAEEVIDILRKEYKTTYTVDSLYTKLLLQKKSYEECIKVANRIPYSVTDDDGVEIGSSNVAWIKSQAQNALGKPGDAADTLLNVLRQHGKLDENLRVLVEYLHGAGRSVEEIADYTREESVSILAALAGGLNIEDSDKILAKLLLLYPNKKEPLAAITKRLTALPVERQMWWSNELRVRGLKTQCPLIATLGDSDFDTEVRLTAGAAAYLAFADKRAVQMGVAVYRDIADDQKKTIFESIAGISQEYASLLSLQSCAVHISFEPCECQGYEHYIYSKWCLEKANTALSRKKDFESFLRYAIKKPTDGFYEIKLDSILSGVSHLEAGRAIKMLAALLAEDGVLDFKVTNLSVALQSMTDGDTFAARAALYGHKRYSSERQHAYIHDAWDKDELAVYLAASGLTLLSCIEQKDLYIRCKKNRFSLIESHTDKFDTSLIVIPGRDISGSDFLEWLERLNGSGDLDTVEIVAVIPATNVSLTQAIDGLSGDIVKIYFTNETDFSSSLDAAVEKSNGENIIYLETGLLPSPGWLEGFKTAFSAPQIGMLSLAVTDEAGIILNAGYKMFSTPEGTLEKIAVKAYLDAKKSLQEETSVDAVGSLCFGLKKELYLESSPISPFLQTTDAIADFSLRVKDLGYQNKVIKNCTLISSNTADSKQSHHSCYPKDGSENLLREEWGECLPQNQEKETQGITASNLLPNTTILERTLKVIPMSSDVSYNGINLIGDFSRDITQNLLYLIKESGFRVSGIDFTYDGIKALTEGPLLPYYVNLLCVPGYRLVDLVGNFGMDIASERYNVLYWDWPTSEVSDEARSETSMVSEVWAPSKFAYRAIKNVSLRNVQIVRPLSKHILQPINSAEGPDKTKFIHIVRLREGWDTEEVTSNALFTIEAFKAAFENTLDVRLEIIFTGVEDKALFARCQELASKSGNVSVSFSSDAEFIRTQIATSGCYISLHKSCAYDLDVITAVANGVLVLATDYGGSRDFLDTRSAEVLPYRQSHLESAIFPLPGNSPVAELETETVVSALRKVRTDYENVYQKTWVARKNLNNLYTAKQSIKVIQDLMKRIGNSTFARKRSVL